MAQLPAYEFKPTEKPILSAKQVQQAFIALGKMCGMGVIIDDARKLRWYTLCLLFASVQHTVLLEYKNEFLQFVANLQMNNSMPFKIFAPFCKYYARLYRAEPQPPPSSELIEQMEQAANLYLKEYSTLPKNFLHLFDISEQVPHGKPFEVVFLVNTVMVRIWDVNPLIIARKFAARMYHAIALAKTDHLPDPIARWKHPIMQENLYRALKWDNSFPDAWYKLGHVMNHKDSYIFACECYSYATECSAVDDWIREDALLEEGKTFLECQDYPQCEGLLAIHGNIPAEGNIVNFVKKLEWIVSEVHKTAKAVYESFGTKDTRPKEETGYDTLVKQLDAYKTMVKLLKDDRQNSKATQGCQCCKKTSGKLHSCKGCCVTFYCSEECQTKDWPLHKDACKQMKKDPIMMSVNSETGIIERMPTSDYMLQKKGEQAIGNTTSAAPQQALCATCKKHKTEMKRCSQCKVVMYCSVECQSKDWKNGHKANCKKQ